MLGGDGGPRQGQPKRRVAAMWLGLLLAPTAWFLHLMTGYVLGGYLCDRDASWALHLATIAALVLGAAGLVAAWRFWRSLPRGGADRAAAPVRMRFMAVSGMAMSTFFIAIIAVAELGNVFLDPCGAT